MYNTMLILSGFSNIYLIICLALFMKHYFENMTLLEYRTNIVKITFPFFIINTSYIVLHPIFHYYNYVFGTDVPQDKASKRGKYIGECLRTQSAKFKQSSSLIKKKKICRFGTFAQCYIGPSANLKFLASLSRRYYVSHP